MNKIIKAIVDFFKRVFGRRKTEPEPVEEIIYNYYEPTPFDVKTLAAINQYRAENELPALEMMPILCSIAGSHAIYMTKLKDKYGNEEYDDHMHDFATQRFQQVQLKTGAERVGEIVAAGFLSVEGFVHGWQTSPKHNEALLSQQFNRAGVANALDEKGTRYSIVLFCKDN